MRLTPMPSPRGTNFARAFIVRQRVSVDRRGMAIDAMPNGSRSGFAETRADLVDPSQARKIGEDDQTRLSNLADFLRGKNLSEDDVRAAVERMLTSEGFSGDDIRQACDNLGIGSSAKFGGGLRGNFAGNLHSEASRDRAMTYEERSGCEPVVGRDARRGVRGRDSFEELFGRQDRVQQIREQSRPRRPRTQNQIAMDSARTANFFTRFPGARRIGNV